MLSLFYSIYVDSSTKPFISNFHRVQFENRDYHCELSSGASGYVYATKTATHRFGFRMLDFILDFVISLLLIIVLIRVSHSLFRSFSHFHSRISTNVYLFVFPSIRLSIVCTDLTVCRMQPPTGLHWEKLIDRPRFSSLMKSDSWKMFNTFEHVAWIECPLVDGFFFIFLFGTLSLNYITFKSKFIVHCCIYWLLHFSILTKND